MSNVKYLEMEDISYKKWSDNLDFASSSRASPWLPAYGYHPPSPIQEVFNTQPVPFLSESSSIGQQPYLVLETIVEETSDDLRSESDKSGPSGWNSDSDAESVIHNPTSSVNVRTWKSHEHHDEVPKKRRRRHVEKLCLSDDDEPHENFESTSLSSRSSSLIAFESLEKHCEDVFVSTGFDDWVATTTMPSSIKRATRFHDNSKLIYDEYENSDEEPEFRSSIDMLHKSKRSSGTFRSSIPNDNLKSYRSFDSLNLFEIIPPVSYSMTELSQSQSALDEEKEKEEELKFVVRDKKLTATTADLSTMTDTWGNGLSKYGPSSRRRQGTASFHYKELLRSKNLNTVFGGDPVATNKILPEDESYDSDQLQLRTSKFIDESSKVKNNKNDCNSVTYLSESSKSHPSNENLSEDSGFDDQMSSKNKSNLGNIRSSTSSTPEEENTFSSASSYSNSFDLSPNRNEELNLLSTTAEREQLKFLNKNTEFSKITEKQKPEAQENFGFVSDADVKYNPAQSQTHMFNRKTKKEELFKQGEFEKLITTPPVSIESPNRNQSNDYFRSCEIVTGSAFLDSFQGKSKSFTRFPEFFDNKSSYDFMDCKMSRKITNEGIDESRIGANRIPVLSTPNLFVRDDDFLSAVPSSASSLTHVPLKYEEDQIEERVPNKSFELSKHRSSGGLGEPHSSISNRGVHFCPVVSEVCWQENFSESSSQASSDKSTDEISNRSLDELHDMENDDEDFLEVEEKSIPRNHDADFKAGKQLYSDSEEMDCNMKLLSKNEGNFLETRKQDLWSPKAKEKNGVPIHVIPPNYKATESLRNDEAYSIDIVPVDFKPYVEEKPVTPSNCVTPTFCDHVSDGSPAQRKLEKRTRLSVSESNLRAQDHVSDDRCGNDVRASLDSIAAPNKEAAMKKSKSRLGEFFERFSFRRLSNRKSSNGNGKKQNGKKEEKSDRSGVLGASSCRVSSPKDVTIIPLHGPENEIEVKEIFRSVVSPYVISAKPPLPPNPSRMSGGSRKRSPSSGTVSVGLQDEETHDKENMPGVRGRFPASDQSTLDPLKSPPCYEESRGDYGKPVGLLETDLDTQITVESAGRRPLVQSNVNNNKKARSLINLGLGDMSVHQNQEENLTTVYLEPPNHRNHGTSTVDDRAKSMEFLLDKDNQAAILPPENELQKGGTSERVMSEHQLRVQRSLQKLDIPEWYKSSAVSQTPQGFLLKRNSESRKENQGWPGLGSKTTSLSSLGSSHSAAARSSTGNALSPGPSPHVFSRWSTSRLNSGFNSSSTSPSGSLRSSFNYRQPYLGWRSQEKLTRPRTPAERLAAGLLPLQKQPFNQSSSQSSVTLNLSDVRTSIKEVTSAIVHYVSGVQENGSKEALKVHQFGSPGPSPKGSTGRLCWLESSFVGSRPLDQPETPLDVAGPPLNTSESRPQHLHLDLEPHLDSNRENSLRLNEDTLKMKSVKEDLGLENTISVRKRPSPSSTTLDDILESLLGLPPTSRSPSPGRTPPILPLPDRQHQRHSCSDIRANVSESVSNSIKIDPLTQRRKSDSGEDIKLKRQRSIERKKSEENSDLGKEDVRKKDTASQLPENLVKCRYSKCGKTATILDAKRTFKTCHNCSHVYCSRECRRAHWERHRRTCLHSRIGALCRQVLTAAKDDPKALHCLSALARRGYLTHGRGAVKIFFSSPELAEKFVTRGYDEMGEPAYVKWSDLLPAEMGADLFTELMKICKSYKPETRMVLYVAICVVSEVPTTGAVKWERQLVSRCCKIALEKSVLPPKEEKQVPPPLPPRKSSSECVNITREMENPDTLILTSLPGICGKIPEHKIREISFINIQRELKQRGVSLRRQFPEVYKKLCSYVEGTLEHFTPVTIYPRDVISGKTFMCIIMPDSEPEKLELVPKDSTRVQTIDISIERNT